MFNFNAVSPDVHRGNVDGFWVFCNPTALVRPVGVRLLFFIINCFAGLFHIVVFIRFVVAFSETPKVFETFGV
jgi:hypothetical protein